MKNIIYHVDFSKTALSVIKAFINPEKIICVTD